MEIVSRNQYQEIPPSIFKNILSNIFSLIPSKMYGSVIFLSKLHVKIYPDIRIPRLTQDCFKDLHKEIMAGYPTYAIRHFTMS